MDDKKLCLEYCISDLTREEAYEMIQAINRIIVENDIECFEMSLINASDYDDEDEEV